MQNDFVEGKVDDDDFDFDSFDFIVQHFLLSNSRHVLVYFHRINCIYTMWR